MARSIWQKTITNETGDIQDGVQITVNVQGGGLATIYGNQSGGTAKANPFLTGANGVAKFFAEPGFYEVIAFKNGETATFEWNNIGDNRLRSDLADPAIDVPIVDDNGDSVVELRKQLAEQGSGKGSDLVNGADFNVESLINFLDVPFVDGKFYGNGGFYPDTIVGGGRWKAVASEPHANFTGGTVVTIEALQAWKDAAIAAGGVTKQNLIDKLNVLLNWTGTGAGAFVRIDDSKFLNPLWFGWVVDWNGTTGTDNSVAWNKICAVSQTDLRDILTPVGESYIAKAGVGNTVYSSVMGQSNLSAVLVFEPPTAETSCYLNAKDSSNIFVKIKPSVTNTTKTFSPTLPGYPSTLDYSATLRGPALGENGKLLESRIESMVRGIVGGGGAVNCQLLGSHIEGGVWGMSFYNKRGIDVTDCHVVGGNSGGAAFPSCKDVTYKGGWVYNPNGTGVNSGGASTAGFNAEHITVVGVRIMARDCVNLENGCEHATVSANIITVLTQLISNGVAVGVFSREADGGGIVSDVTVSDNEIDTGDISYAESIKVGYETTTTGIIVDGVTITGNKGRRASSGLNLVAPASSFLKNVKVADNNFIVNTTGINLGNLEDFDVGDNNISRTSGTTVSATYGVRFGTLKKGILHGNKIKGLFEHYEQNGLVTNAEVWASKDFKNDDESNFILLQNNSGGAAIGFKSFA